MSLLIQARWVVPVSSPPIENGAVLVEGDRIRYVGARQAAPLQNAPLFDLKDSILLPGLVNAHCHLEHSRLHNTPQPPLTLRGGKSKIPPLNLRGGEGGIFTEWVREMGCVGATRRVALTEAIDRLIQTGTTTVADHCSPDTPPFETPFRRIIFWEVLGADRERAMRSFDEVMRRAAREGGFVTPHSLYGVHREILELTIGRVVRGKVYGGGSSRRQNLSEATGPALSLHLLESSDEEEFFRKGSGPLADYVVEKGGAIPFPERSPVKWLCKQLGAQQVAPLLIHGNYLNDEEIDLLQHHGAGVIHCPGSHRFFGHRRFPLEALKKKGVPVALGTDSLASNEDLSMLREMRLLRESYPELDEATILKMATIEGARLLRMEKEIGSLEVGKKADLIAVKGGVLEAEAVTFSMIDGKVILNHV